MTVDDEFGPHPGRPTHPDFSILVELIQFQDDLSDRPGFDLDAFLAEAGDPASIRYMAIQRGLRMATTRGADQRFANATCWIDGFMMGARFARRRDQ